MPYNRPKTTTHQPEAAILTKQMAGIGMNFAADPDLSAAEAARRAGCSFATAWAVVRDFTLLQGAAEAKATQNRFQNGNDSPLAPPRGFRSPDHP